MDIEEYSQEVSDSSDFTLVVEALEGLQLLPQTPLLK